MAFGLITFHQTIQTSIVFAWAPIETGELQGYPWTRRRLQGAPLCLEELTGNNKYFNFLVSLWI